MDLARDPSTCLLDTLPILILDNLKFQNLLYRKARNWTSYFYTEWVKVPFWTPYFKILAKPMKSPQLTNQVLKKIMFALIFLPPFKTNVMVAPSCEYPLCGSENVSECAEWDMMGSMCLYRWECVDMCSNTGRV